MEGQTVREDQELKAISSLPERPQAPMADCASDGPLRLPSE